MLYRGGVYGTCAHTHTEQQAQLYTKASLVCTMASLSWIWFLPLYTKPEQHSDSQLCFLITLLSHASTHFLFRTDDPICTQDFCFAPRSTHTFSVSSFLTDLRLARRSIETLCFEPSSERRMASADTRTRRRVGLLNFPLRSNTLMLKS